MKHPILHLLAGPRAPLGKPAPGAEQAISGIHKTPVAAPLWLAFNGLHGDEQGDRVYHGGAEKAVHHYAFEHYESWRQRFGNQEVLAQAGAFGENIATLGMTERNVHIGDIYRIGEVLLQVSQGRQPCWKLNLRFNRQHAALKVQESGHTGWYYRVLREGWLDPRASLELVERPQADWPLQRLIAALFCLGGDAAGRRDEWRAAAVIAELTPGWRTTFERRLARGVVENWDKRLNG